MKLRGINFGKILGASGVEGFYGEGYPYHRYLNYVPGFGFKGMTFVAKTTTLLPRAGNMPLKEDGITPQEFKPRCIVVKPWHGVALNAVGLSGPGAEALFQSGEWQELTEPFFLSFMSIANTAEERIEEACMFFEMLAKHLPYFKAPVGLQINFSCPNLNIGINQDAILSEASTVLRAGKDLGIPLMPKFNIFLPLSVAKVLDQDPNCDGICMSNTIPWKDVPEDWKIKYFGSTTSPLAEFGGGGLSRKPLLPLVCEWVKSARMCGIKMPINAGGGTLCTRDVKKLEKAGADSVFLGSAVFLRPWRMESIIKTAQRTFG